MVKMVSFFTICHPVFIPEVKLKLKHGCWKFTKTVSIFDLGQSFKLKPKLKLECVKKMPREPQIMTIHVFVSTLYNKNWSSFSSFEDLTYFLTWWCYRWCHGYVTHNLHSQLPPPIILQNIVRVAPVLHRAIVWTNMVTNTLHENIITSLLWVIITVKSKVHQIPRLKCFVSCSGLCPIHWSHVFSREWRCSWSSAGRWCSNYIWMINILID